MSGPPPAQEAVGLDAESEHAPERRRVTVMFCDLVGSTPMASRMDLEDWCNVVHDYQQMAADVVAQFGGFVSRYQGDGILILFGYPHTHEDGPARAIQAALEIVRRVKALHPQLEAIAGQKLAVRVGLTTGLVVAGDLLGSGDLERQSAIVVGEPPNLAARIQGLAQADEIVVSDETRRMTSGLFEFDDLGPQALKGFVEPVRVWKVIGQRKVDSRFQGHRFRLTPMVDRKKPIADLYALWQQAEQGRGRVALLCGEAGIGKSRIVHALRERIDDTPHTLMLYQCSPYHENSALYPVIKQIEAAIGVERKTTARQRLIRLEHFLARVFGERSPETVALMAALLSIPIGEKYPPLELGPQQHKERTFAILVGQLKELAARQPVLIVVEDAHWIDPTSRELLDHYIQHAEGARVLMLVTYRPEFEPPWAERAHVDRIQIKKLTRPQTATLVKHAAHGKPMPAEVMEQILAKTDGVPLFAEELTMTLQTSGLLREESDRYVLEGPLPPRAVPTTLYDSLMARLDTLSKVREVAQIGATIGREFPHELLAAVSDLPPRQRDEALEQLVESGLIVQRGTPPDAVYVFKHALLRDAAYESVLKSRRRTLHARIARVIEGLEYERVDTEPEILAYHFSEAGLNEKAVDYYRSAGRRALAQSANWEAVGHATQGLEVLRALPTESERDRQELDFQLILGVAYRATRGFASGEAEASFRRALELCEQVGNPVQHADALRGLYACTYVRGDLNTAREQAQRVLDLGGALESGDKMVGHWMLGCVLFWQGEFTATRRALEQALGLYDRKAQRVKLLSHEIDPAVSARMHLGWTLWTLGYPKSAGDVSRQAVQAALELEQPHAVALAYFFQCCTDLCRGDLVATAKTCKALTAISAERGFAYLSACANVVEGQVLIAKEQYEEGLIQIQRGLQGFDAQSAGVGRPWTLAYPIAACTKLRRFDEVAGMLRAARVPIEQNNERHWEAELYRLEGELVLAQTPPDEDMAKAHFQRAIEIARAQQAKSLELRAAIALAGLLRARADKADARTLLRHTLSGFPEGADTADHEAASRLLREL